MVSRNPPFGESEIRPCGREAAQFGGGVFYRLVGGVHVNLDRLAELAHGVDDGLEAGLVQRRVEGALGDDDFDDPRVAGETAVRFGKRLSGDGGGGPPGEACQRDSLLVVASDSGAARTASNPLRACATTRSFLCWGNSMRSPSSAERKRTGTAKDAELVTAL